MESDKTLEQQLEYHKQKISDLQKKIKERDLANNPKTIIDKIQNYEDVLAISGTKESDDEVSIKGFDAAENELVKNLLKKIRICKVYNEGWLPKRGDQRWYNWYAVSSGLGFHDADYVASLTSTSSASRLCLKNEVLALDFNKKFGYIEEAIISIK